MFYILYCNYNLAESGIGQQTQAVNTLRPFFKTPQVHDGKSIRIYKAMKAAFPLLDEKTHLLHRDPTVLPGGLLQKLTKCTRRLFGIWLGHKT